MREYPTVVEHASDLGPCAWRTATYSNETSNCVKVAALGGAAAVTDSKAQDGPAFTVGSSAWQGFLASIR
jgi:hypothetical protein